MISSIGQTVIQQNQRMKQQMGFGISGGAKARLQQISTTVIRETAKAPLWIAPTVFLDGGTGLGLGLCVKILTDCAEGLKAKERMSSLNLLKISKKLMYLEKLPII